MQIFIVTEGCYSDYRIIGAYSTIEKAVAAAKQYNLDNEIEVYTLDAEDLFPQNHTLFNCTIDYDGTINHCNPLSPEDYLRYYMDIDKPNIFGEYIKGKYHNNLHCNIFVWATSREHAVKIVSEKRAFLIATNQWSPPFITSEQPE